MGTKLFKFKSKHILETTAFLQQSEYYNNKAIHLSIFDANSGEQLCVATANGQGQRPDEGNVYIKNYSENEGVYEALLAAGIIGPVIRKVPAGFTHLYECEYLWGKGDGEWVTP